MAIKFTHLPVDTIRITSEWKEYRSATELHDGLDIGSTPKGATNNKIYAVADGKVIVSKFNQGGYGNYLCVQHNGFITLYGHMQSLMLKVGDIVKGGQQIGLIGNTGSSSGYHLHFRLIGGNILKFDRNPQTHLTWYSVDPTPYINDLIVFNDCKNILSKTVSAPIDWINFISNQSDMPYIDDLIVKVYNNRNKAKEGWEITVKRVASSSEARIAEINKCIESGVYPQKYLGELIIKINMAV